MSEPAAAGTEAEDTPALQSTPFSDDVFAQVMDFMAPEGDKKEGAEGGTAAAADAGGTGSAAASNEGDGADKPDAGAPAAGDAGKPPVADGTDVPSAGEGKPAEGGQADSGGKPEAAAASDTAPSAAEFLPKLGEFSTKIEENTAKAFHEEALEAVKSEHSAYFNALETPDRIMVGKTVPSLDGEGTEVLRDEEDVRSWKTALKSILVDEVKDRASSLLEDSGPYLNTIHASLEMFKNNVDLIPGTKDFDKELADKFAVFAKPYEVRDDEEKLIGWSIPTQPIINQLRADLVAARGAKSDPPPTEKTEQKGEVTQPASSKSEDDPPQVGITSKAGSSTESEDFSTLFGTLAPELRDLRI